MPSWRGSGQGRREPGKKGRRRKNVQFCDHEQWGALLCTYYVILCPIGTPLVNLVMPKWQYSTYKCWILPANSDYPITERNITYHYHLSTTSLQLGGFQQ